MYGIGGERDLTERTLDHLSGYEGARPVRVGNGAWNQQQHDVWGMIVDALDVQFHAGAAQIVTPVWEGVAGFVDEALRRWQRTRPGHLGSPRRPEAVHRVEGDVLGGGGARRRSGRATG